LMMLIPVADAPYAGPGRCQRLRAPCGGGTGWGSRLRFRRGDDINLHRLKTPVHRRRPAKVAQKRHQHVAIRVLVDGGRMPRRLDIGLAAAQVGEVALAQPVEQVPPNAGLARVNVGPIICAISSKRR
jgi:hypothetical protein